MLYRILIVVVYILQTLCFQASYHPGIPNSTSTEMKYVRRTRSTGTSFSKCKTRNYFQAVLALEGQSITLYCNGCITMRKSTYSLIIGWQVVRASDGQASYILINDRIKIADDWSLSISDIDITDAGQYMCMMSGVYQAKFQVDVLLRERRKIIKETEMGKLLPSQFLPGNNIELLSVWSDWSECNHCGQMGQRHKIGLCMVRKIDYRRDIAPVDVPMMNSFIDGIPCRSPILPTKVAHKKLVRTRPTEVLIGACSMPCPTMQPFITVTDKDGNVVEVVEAGFYSLK